MEGKWFDLKKMATVKHCHHFQHLHLYTFKVVGGQKRCTYLGDAELFGEHSEGAV